MEMGKVDWKVLTPPIEGWANEWITVRDSLVQLPTGVKAFFMRSKVLTAQPYWQWMTKSVPLSIANFVLRWER